MRGARAGRDVRAAASAQLGQLAEELAAACPAQPGVQPPVL